MASVNAANLIEAQNYAKLALASVYIRVARDFLSMTGPPVLIAYERQNSPSSSSLAVSTFVDRTSVPVIFSRESARTSVIPVEVTRYLL